MEVEVSLCPNAKPSEKVSWTVWNLQHVVRLRYAKEGCVQCWKGLWVAKGLLDCLLLRVTGMFLKTRDRIFSGLVVASVHFYRRGCRNGSKRLYLSQPGKSQRNTSSFPFGGYRHLTKAPARLTDGSKGQRTTHISHKLSDSVGWLVGWRSGDADESGLDIYSSWSHVKWVFTSGCKWFDSRLFFFLGILG